MAGLRQTPDVACCCERQSNVGSHASRCGPPSNARSARDRDATSQSVRGVRAPHEPRRSLDRLLRGFAGRLANYEEILEPAKVESKFPRPVLPHRVHRSVVVAHDAHDVDGLEVPDEHPEHVEADGCELAMAILIADEPSDDVAGLQRPMKFPRDLLHHLEPPRGASRNLTETCGLVAVVDVVRVWRVDEMQIDGVAEKWEMAGVAPSDVRPS